MRLAVIAYATKHKSESEDVFVPVIAATIEYADLFLSRKKKIPEEHNVAKARYILDMRDRIHEGIDGVKQPLKSPWDGLDYFFDLLTMDEDISLHHLRLPMWEIVVAIRRDIKFTEFKHSTLVAATVLVTSLKFQPELFSWFSERIFQRYHNSFNESEVKRCLSEMEGHFIVEEVFARPKQPRLLRDIPGDEKKKDKGKGKEPMYQEYSIDGLCERFQDFDIAGYCEKFTEFDMDWLEPDPNTPPDSP